MKRAVLLLLLIVVARPLHAFEPPPLARPDAQRILEAMSWTEITIVAIRQGVNGQGDAAPIFATVIGFGKSAGKNRGFTETLYYDRELDWHALELADRGARIWNKNDYQEIKPWATW